MAFLDNLQKWVMVLFLEKIGANPRRAVTAAKLNERFARAHYRDTDER
jgi:hypothetical protein